MARLKCRRCHLPSSKQLYVKAADLVCAQGHTVAGYACQPSISADGRYVLSGDGAGKLWVWDWKSTKAFRNFQAHDGVCIGTAWHPMESSKVATCGWDGLIKYWD